LQEFGSVGDKALNCELCPRGIPISQPLFLIYGPLCRTRPKSNGQKISRHSTAGVHYAPRKVNVRQLNTAQMAITHAAV